MTGIAQLLERSRSGGSASGGGKPGTPRGVDAAGGNGAACDGARVAVAGPDNVMLEVAGGDLVSIDVPPNNMRRQTATDCGRF